MERIRQIIEEIKDLEKDATHRATLRIYSLLENNRRLFLEKMETDDFEHLLAGFEALTERSPVDYATSAYKDDFRKNYQALAFYLNRII